MPRHTRIGLAVLLAVGLTLFAWLAGHILLFPYGMNYGEAPLVDQAARLAAGETIYKSSLATPPYVIANYPPLYPLLMAGVGHVTRLSLLAVGRGISLLAALFSALALGALAARFTGSRLAGWLAAGLFLSHPDVAQWAALARVDLLALAFSLGGLWIVYTRWQSWRWLALAALCLLAAVYTRQTFLLAAPLSAVAWIGYNDRRRGLAFLGLLAAPCLGLFWALNSLTRGGFYLNIIVANVNAYEAGRAGLMFTHLLLIWPVIFVLAACAALLAPHKVMDAGQPVLLYGLLIYTAGALMTALTVGKVGSDVNYALELLAACALWAACALAWLPRRGLMRPSLLVGVLALQLLWVFTADVRLYQSSVAGPWAARPKYDAMYQEVQAASRTGPILSDNRLDMVALAGGRIYYQPFEYQQLSAAGLWQPAALTADVNTQRFPLIIVSNPGALTDCCWSPSVSAAIEARYEAGPSSLGVRLYRPRRAN
jgi:hypothetical protein